jgi:hypothetical protein
MNDHELMADALKWLTTPELQYQVTERPLSFVASVHRQYRTNNKISAKQRTYVIAILNKHWNPHVVL